MKIYFGNRYLQIIEKVNANVDEYSFASRINEFEQATTLWKEFEISSLKQFTAQFQKHFKFIEAAGGVVFNPNKEILFIFRLNKWDLPKGKIDKGETPEIAALREVEEECGIQSISITKSLPSTYHTYHLKNTFILKQTFWFEMMFDGDESLIPQTEENITDIRWMGKEKLSKILENTYPSIIDVLHCVDWK